MGKVAEQLQSHATLPITLLAECDIICAFCPHNKGKKCQKKPDSESKVRAKDLEVLRRLGFDAGTQMPVGKTWTRLKEKVTVKDITDICRGCEWLELGYCAQGLERLRAD